MIEDFCNENSYIFQGQQFSLPKTFNQILPREEGDCRNLQIRNTQNSGRQLAGGSGRHVVCQYNQPGLHNSDKIPSVNGNIIIKNSTLIR